MIRIFWYLIKEDLMLIKSNLQKILINSLVWSSCIIIISSYVLQSFGMSEQFGIFQVGSVIISVEGFQMFTEIFNFIEDLNGKKHIYYKLALPIPNYLIFAKMIIFYIINCLILSLTVIPVAKIILLDKFVFSQIDLLNFIMVLIVSSMFFGIFTLFLVSLIKETSSIGNVIMRIVFPLWFFGGFQFSWKSISTTSPTLAYASLVSPYLYAHEAIRSAMFNPNDFIPFWTSILSLIMFTLILGFIGYKRLKKRLDFI